MKNRVNSPGKLRSQGKQETVVCTTQDKVMCEKYDAYFDSDTGKWLEKRCSSKNCTYCSKRPRKHIPHKWIYIDGSVGMCPLVAEKNKYIYAYDSKVKRRVVFAIKGKHAISLVTGVKIKYERNKDVKS